MVKIKERDTKSSEQVVDKVFLGTIYALSKRIGMSANILRGLFILFGIFNMGFSIIVYIVGTVLVGSDKLQETQEPQGTQEPQDSWIEFLESSLKDSMSIDISGNATTESKPKQTMTVDDLPPLDEDEAYHPLSGDGSGETDVTVQVKDEPSVSEGFATIRDELGSNNLDGLVETGTSDLSDGKRNTDDIWGDKTKSIWDEEQPNIWD